MTTELQQAISAIKAGDKESGRRLLAGVLQADPRNEMAWLCMSAVVDSDEQRRTCLERVLAINPNNDLARRGLERLGTSSPPPSPKPQPIPVPEISRRPESLPPLQALKALDREATKKCPYCAETIKAEAIMCRFCGRDLRTGQPRLPHQAQSAGTAQVPQRLQPSPPPEPAPKSRQKGGRSRTWILIILVGVMALICCVTLLFTVRDENLGSSPSSPQPTKTPTPDTGDALGACLICKDFVQERLVAPRSAEFPSCSEATVSKLDSNTWVVASYVEAQNRMGVMLKSVYGCEVTYVGNDRWTLDNLLFEEDLY